MNTDTPLYSCVDEELYCCDLFLRDRDDFYRSIDEAPVGEGYWCLQAKQVFGNNQRYVGY